MPFPFSLTCARDSGLLQESRCRSTNMNSGKWKFGPCLRSKPGAERALGPRPCALLRSACQPMREVWKSHQQMLGQRRGVAKKPKSACDPCVTRLKGGRAQRKWHFPVEKGEHGWCNSAVLRGWPEKTVTNTTVFVCFPARRLHAGLLYCIPKVGRKNVAWGENTGAALGFFPSISLSKGVGQRADKGADVSQAGAWGRINI